MTPKIFLPIDKEYQKFILDNYTGKQAYTYYKLCHQRILTRRETVDLDTFLLTTLKHQWFSQPSEFVKIVYNQPGHSRWAEDYNYYKCTDPCRVILEFNEFFVKCIFANNYEEFDKDNPLVVGLRKFLDRQGIWMEMEF